MASPTPWTAQRPELAPGAAAQETRRDAALARIHAAAAEAEGRLASGPHRVVAPNTPGREGLDRLRTAMAEAEAKLAANGRPSHKRAAAEQPEARATRPEPAAVAESAALAALRRALAEADARVGDTKGKGYLGSHTPQWTPGPQWVPGNAAFALQTAPAHVAWPLVQKLAAASDAAAEATAAAATQAASNVAQQPVFWGDVGERLVRRFATPPSLRPGSWAHTPAPEKPAPPAGRRGLARGATPLPYPPPPPPVRSQSTGRLSFSLSSPARHRWELSVSLGATVAPAGGAMADAPVVVSAAATKTIKWDTPPPPRMPACVLEPAPGAKTGGPCLADVPLPWLTESRGMAPERGAGPAKPAADCTPAPSPAFPALPPPVAIRRPRFETPLPAEVEDAVPPARCRPKPQRVVPHIVRRKARRIETQTAALPPVGTALLPPAAPPGADSAPARPRQLLKAPPLESAVAPPTWQVPQPAPLTESSGTPPLPVAPSLSSAPPAALSASPLPPLAPPAVAGAQAETACVLSDETPRAIAQPKRWRSRARLQEKKHIIVLSRWEAACIIQAHVRGMEARRLISALKARVLLKTHLAGGVKGDSLNTPASLAPAALRHVKVLAEAYERTGRRFGALPPAARAPNRVLSIYQAQGEEAALAYAAQEALTWTNWIVPLVARDAETEAGNAAALALTDARASIPDAPSQRAFADRVALKAAAEVAAPAIARLTQAGLKGEKLAAAPTVANALRAKPAQLPVVPPPRQLPPIRTAVAPPPPPPPAAAPVTPPASPLRARLPPQPLARLVSLLAGKPGGLSKAAAALRIQAAWRGRKGRLVADVAAARAALRTAVAAVRQRGAKAEPAVLEATMALGDAYLRCGNRSRAEQCYMHVLETLERDAQPGDPRCVRPASALARIFMERGEPARAAEMMKRVSVAAPAKGAPPPAAAQAQPFSMFGAGAGVQEVFAEGGKALAGVSDSLASALSFGWLSSQPVKGA